MTEPAIRLAIALELELQKFTLGPDDVIVIKSERPLRYELRDQMEKLIRNMPLAKRRVIWIDPEITFSVVTKDEAERLAPPETPTTRIP